MSNRAVSLLLDDISEAIEKIEKYTGGLDQNSFKTDDKTSDAVTRNLEIIGEAANRLPADFLKLHPEVEWEKIIGLRHRIVHEYFGVDLSLIWQILQKDLPGFKINLEKIRSSLTP
jgi:uncharacterized protein with HEPN domain